MRVVLPLPTPCRKQEAPGVGQEPERRLLPWQGGAAGAKGLEHGGGKLVYLTTPCTSLEAFVETKVCGITCGFQESSLGEMHWMDDSNTPIAQPRGRLRSPTAVGNSKDGMTWM